MIFLTSIVAIIGSLICLYLLSSVIGTGYNVIKMMKHSTPKSATPTERDLFLERLDQESYIMSLKVVSNNVGATQTQLQEEINNNAHVLKERLISRRSSYELLNQ